MKTFAKIFCLGLVTASTACHSVRRGEPFVGTMHLNSKQERGALIFQQRCHQCHPQGEAGLGPALNNKPAPVFLMKTQVRLGLGAMPRFDAHAISESELDDLMAYVIALRKADKNKADGQQTDESQKKEKSKSSGDQNAPKPTRPTK